LLTLSLNFDEDDEDSSEKKKMGPLKERHHSKRGGGEEVKQLLRPMHATNVQLETPPNCQKETSITKS